MGARWTRVTAGFVAGVVALALGGAVSPGRAQAQEEPLAPPPPPVRITLAERPSYIVEFRGDQGPVRIVGVLEETPREPLRLYGGTEVPWSQVRSLSRVSYPSEGIPVDSLLVGTVADPAVRSSLAVGGFTRDYVQVRNEGRRLQRIPEGRLLVRGEPYGAIPVTLDRLDNLTLDPLRGNLTVLPRGGIRLEVLAGTEVTLPAEELIFLQRDTVRGTALVELADGQTFTGRLVSLPEAPFTVDTPRGRVALRLDQVTVFERTIPGGRLQ